MLILEWQALIDNPIKTGSALSCGVFDGVHKGHRVLIGKVKQKSILSGLKSVIVTFRENPARILRPQDKTMEIIRLEEKIRLIEKLGIDITVLIDFSVDFSRMSGEAFIESLIVNAGMRYLAVGENFRCGFRGSLGAGGIKDFCEGRGVEADVIGPVLSDGGPVSSSRIREALSLGDKAMAARLLGYKI